MNTREVTSPWSGPYGRAAVAVVLVTVALRAVFVAGSFFNQDDYVAMAWTKEYGFSWDYLWIEFAGHVGPGQRIIYALVVKISPMSWVPAAVVTDLLVAAGSLLMWCVLVRLGGKGRHALFGLLFFSLAPMVLVVSLWFGAALALWPPMLAGLGAVLLFLRGHQGARGGRLNFALIPAAMTLGLAFHERSVLVAPLVFGVAMLAGGPHDGPLGPFSVARRFWALWLCLAAVAGGYLAFYLTHVDMAGGASPSVGDNIKLIGWFVGRAVAPALVTGPWQATHNGGAVVPDLWVVAVSSAVVLLALAVAVWRGGRVGRMAVMVFVGYLVLEIVVLVLSRGGYGAVIALDPRYSADMILPATLCMVATLAHRDAPCFTPRRPGAQRFRTSLVWAVVCLAVVGPVVTMLVVAPGAQNKEDRAFVTNLRTDLRLDPRVVLVDRQVPADIVIGVFGEYAMLSRVTEPFPEKPLFDKASEQLRAVADDGHLVEPQMLSAAVVSSNPRRTCRHPVTATPMALRLDDYVSGSVLVRVDYFTNISGRVTLTLGLGSVVMPVREGANHVYAMLDAGDPRTRIVRLRAEQFGATAVCVSYLAVGPPATP